MNLLNRAFWTVLLLSMLPANLAMAQRPPKYVRTPYAEVYRDPWGGKHVRTPFVEIHKPGRVPYGYAGPPVAYPVPEGAYYQGTPMRGEVQQSQRPVSNLPPDVQARNQIYASAAELNRSLGQFATASTWRRYFALNEGETLAPVKRNGDPAQTASEFLALLGRFESVNQDEKYPMIAALPAFQRTYELLQLYLAEHGADAKSATEEIPPPLPDEVRRGNLRR